MASADDRLFSATEIHEYLGRIGLKHEDLDTCTKVQGLRKLHVAHLTSVPFDTTAVHLSPNWWSEPGSQAPVFTGRDHPNQPELVSAKPNDTWRNIVKSRRGGYCWSLNSSFARLLLTLGYEVSQLPARVYTPRNQDPAKAGYFWTPICHVCLLVNTEEGRFVCDVGFGGGSPAYPMPFMEHVEITSLTAGEKFRLVRRQCPGLQLVDEPEGYTVERWCGEWWSPGYHFYLSPLTLQDIEVYNWYNTTHPDAVFKSFLVVTLLKLDGSRRTILCNLKDGQPGEIKLFSKKTITSEETDVRYIKPTRSELFQALKLEFGWGPE